MGILWEVDLMKLRLIGIRENLAPIRLTDQPLTMGRSHEADVVLADEKASRLHCGIGIQDGEFVLKDLQSKNGTYLNEIMIEAEAIKPGDKIRIGSTIFRVEEDDKKPGSNIALHEVEEEMTHGKGYTTILREIVDEVDDSAGGGKP